MENNGSQLLESQDPDYFPNPEVATQIYSTKPKALSVLCRKCIIKNIKLICVCCKLNAHHVFYI